MVVYYIYLTSENNELCKYTQNLPFGLNHGNDNINLKVTWGFPIPDKI